MDVLASVDIVDDYLVFELPYGCESCFRMALAFWALLVCGFAPPWCPIVELFIYQKENTTRKGLANLFVL